MSTGYKIADKEGMYYLTFQVIDWVDIFTRQNYRNIIIESFNFCRETKGLRIWAYAIMSNHVHCILSADKNDLSKIIKDFKGFTGHKIIETIHIEPESRRDWMLKRFGFAARQNKRNCNYQFWTHENHAVELYTYKFMLQKLGYIHDNPVRAGLVEKAEDWLYSSQRNYLGLQALIEIDLIDL